MHPRSAALFLAALIAWVGGVPAVCLAQPGFNGPTILTRGVRPFGPGNSRPIPIHAQATITTGYTTGLGLPGTEGPSGRVPEQDSLVSALSFGVSGSREQNRSSLTMSYAGGYTLFSNQGFYNGLNQQLTIDYSRALSRQWTFQAGVSGRQQNSILGAPITAQNFNSFAPVTDVTGEVFDNAIIQAGANAGVSYRHSARLTFGMSGGAFTIQRRSDSLASGNSYGGSGQVSYSLSRRTTIGATYQYSRMKFQRGYGTTNAQQAMAQFGYSLNRNWSVDLGAGLFVADSERIGLVRVDPLIELLTGVRSSLEVLRNDNQGLSAQAGLSGRYGNTAISIAYSRGVSPGNGVLLTSLQEGVTASIGWRASDRVNLSASAQTVRMEQLLQLSATSNAKADAVRGSGAMSYRISPWLHFTATCQLQRVKLGSFDRTRMAVMGGLAIRSGEFPLSLF